MQRKYFKYEKSGNFYCLKAAEKIPHIYVYLKDSYSFNEKQYLGHWNKHGVIIAPGSILTGSSSPKRDSDVDIWSRNLNKPVDTRRSFSGKSKPPMFAFQSITPTTAAGGRNITGEETS
ncbi:DUF6402 family protein [Burkholderia arboris]|uniref:DUF6402 family protein n=1 Tax=Burkholderia arboris TaxID=488730 RepID=UPI003709979B